MVKAGKWICERILKVLLLSLRKSKENCCGPSSLIKQSLKEEGCLWKREHYLKMGSSTKSQKAYGSKKKQRPSESLSHAYVSNKQTKSHDLKNLQASDRNL